ncbi:MFS transporter [Stackebrandtia nassauensis]|uniref:Major facilitator superfamily MFS_1 n=1 Tax=Stackebrandtia nassauensis (strain DSM 44728 / CIP 108903 / NRRL B-16338 / NBRC 102104 / LLR-40K-21) TaxID=446470 RepID=D3Q3Q4_STANL|nr:MFS transporter [Stackebrandtia nassauensis]ADD43971.1 major facilitator superfamily MFS_1 [Stackebrandtia nassauensis DSM 44728]
MSTVTIAPTTTTTTPDANPRRWVGLAVLCASLLIVVMDLTILNVALPEIDAALRPSSVQLLWIVDVYGLAVAGFLVTASGLADRFGRRRMLLVGYAAFGTVPLIVLFADSAPWLIAARALLGLGGAFIMPSTMSMIRDLFADPKERAVALGLWGSMAAVGAGLGPIIGGILVQNFSWHAAFLINTPIMVLAIVFALWLLPESRGGAVPWDFLGIALSIIGMISLMYAIKTIGKHGITDPTALLTGTIALVSLIWFARRCLNRREPLLDLRLLRRRPLSAGLMCALISSVAMAAMMLLLAQWMQLVMEYTPIQTGIHLLPVAIVSGVISPLAPRIAQSIGTRTVMAGGLAVGGLGFAILYLGGDHLDYPLVALSQSLVGVSMATLAIGSAVIVASVPVERTGNAAAMEETSFELGNALGVAVLGSIAAVVFHNLMAATRLESLGLTGSAASTASDSIGGALSVASHTGNTALADHARAAFTESLGIVGLAGGVLMLLAAVAVWYLTPRGLTVEGGHH